MWHHRRPPQRIAALLSQLHLDRLIELLVILRLGEMLLGRLGNHNRLQTLLWLVINEVLPLQRNDLAHKSPPASKIPFLRLALFVSTLIAYARTSPAPHRRLIIALHSRLPIRSRFALHCS